MLTHLIDRSALKLRATVTVLPLPNKDYGDLDDVADEWQHCTAFVSLSYGGCSVRAFLANASFASQDEFEHDAVFTVMLDAALLDLEEEIEKSLQVFSAVLC